jgi:hypothetical protein
MDVDMTDKDREDQRIHFEAMQQRYLVWYEGPGGGLFSTDVSGALDGGGCARWNRDLFIAEGYSARIVKLTVVNGQPVAEWVT